MLSRSLPKRATHPKALRTSSSNNSHPNVPLVVGLIVGGYIKEFKLGDYSVGVGAARILEKSELVADSAPRGAERKAELRHITGWLEERNKE
jgi:hypothetical protein